MDTAKLEAKRLAIALSRGIIVDTQDAWLLQTHVWHITKPGYVRTNAYGTRLLLHTCIIGMPIKRNWVVHHKDNNPLNNCRDNLEYADRPTNRMESRDLREKYKHVLAIARARLALDT